jgi:hypothetical protein
LSGKREVWRDALRAFAGSVCRKPLAVAVDEGHYKSHCTRESELMTRTRKSLKELVDVTGFEPATPLLAKLG